MKFPCYQKKKKKRRQQQQQQPKIVTCDELDLTSIYFVAQNKTYKLVKGL